MQSQSSVMMRGLESASSDKTDGETGEKDGSLSRDELFHILRNQRRRFILHKLKYESGPVEIRDLITQVAAWENEISAEELSSKQRRSVYNAIHQTHLPTLAEAGIVDIDRHEVELTDDTKDIDIYLELVNKGDIPWAKYYILLTSVHAISYIIVRLDITPFAGISPAAIVAVWVIALFLSSVFHYYDQHTARIGAEKKPPEVSHEGEE